MAKYYAYISSAANVATNFNPRSSYTGNGNYLRLEYVGNITTGGSVNIYVWRQTEGNWFSFEQGSFKQYLNLGNTTYVTNVNNVEANRRNFNSDNLRNPAVFVLDNGNASLTFENWTTTGNYSGDFPDNNVCFFPTSSAVNLKMYFYEFKVYGSGDTLLFDFVPDLSGSTKGIRDKVSGNFFSATNQSYITLYDFSTFETDITAITAAYNSTTCAVTLTADEDMAWTASTSNDWITLSTTGGTGSSVFTVSVAANKAYAARNGLVTLTNGEDVIEITVEQAKYPLLIPNENIYRADLEVVKGYRSGSSINKAYRSGELIYYKLNYSQGPDYKSMPLTFNIISAGTINWIASDSSYTKDIQYSVNNGPWSSITSSTGGTQISLNRGDVVRFKGDGAISTGNDAYNSFSGSTAIFEASGNVVSLIDSTNYATVTIVADYSFQNLFGGVTGLTSAENLILPATTLAYRCYYSMFQGCTSLTSAPELPATTLATTCYCYMFSGCTGLTTAPALPATTLTDSCYYGMFQGCTSLTTAPELPATTLTDTCYSHMFDGCTSLTTAPELPATTLESYCYSHMFYGCTSLTTAPELPATTLVSYCYRFMFSGCSNLNYIKCLATSGISNANLNSWVQGVAASGTFVKNANATWRTGYNGIPSGWTIQNAT